MTGKHSIRLFVYGTLLRGGRYHARYCGSASDIGPATVTGRLYDLDAGYPTLAVPSEAVLAAGTADPLGDAKTADTWPVSSPAPAADGDWDAVHGELVTFPNPAESLPALDRLEEYEPGATSNLYERVLVLVECDAGLTAAWTYVGSERLLGQGRRIVGGKWAPNR